MVLWGAIWGGLLGILWPGHMDGLQLVVGALLGALAGRMLRDAIRKEIDARMAGQAVAKAVAETAPETVPSRPERPWALEEQARKTATGARAAPAEPAFEDTQPLPIDAAPVVAAVAAPSPAPAAVPAEPPLAAQPLAPPGPGVIDALVIRARDWLFGGNTVVRMGVLVLFIGLAFLARYAVENALLPPELRLAGIGLAGVVLFVAGLRMRRRAADKVAYALTLQGAGVAVLYLTVFAAFRLYQFLPAGAAFGALALICAFSAVIALAQNAMAMAFIGFAGGFAAPLLVSTGQGSHTGLFSYYLVLGVAIAAMAWARAWRALNLLGFFATFGIATLWGVLQYRPEHFASTEPFLLGFFGVYLGASLFYALRHRLAARRAIDATMIFGVPIVAFGLQAALTRPFEFATAYSALALGAFYLVLGAWAARRHDEVGRWLAECFLAIGLGFVTLAVPLALDARWTSAVWAIEGAGVYWMGRRQDRWLARAAGLALQVFATASFLDASMAASRLGPWPFAHPAFIGAAMLAFAALAIGWWSREPATAPDHAIGRRIVEIENALSPFLFWVGFLWWQVALDHEIRRMTSDLQGHAVAAYGLGLQLHLHLLAWVGSTWIVHGLALPRRARPWATAATPAWTTLPVLLLAALQGAATLPHVFVSGGWLAWPVALALHAHLLRRFDDGRPEGWWPWVHAGGVWLLVLLAGNALVFAVDQAGLWQTAWAAVILLVAGTAVLLVLTRRTGFETPAIRQRWPLDRFAHAYLWIAAAPLTLAVALGSLLVAVQSDGNARPLPYLPLLNPTDLAVALGLAACARWMLRLRTSALALPAAARDPRWALVLAALGFVAINTVWLRVAHHYADVPWNGPSLFNSFLVQAGYSILWTLLALGLMVGGHRGARRSVWMTGAGLLGATVLKLFVIDLSNRGGTERIVVFIAVGVLMLVVGYFAPMPPAARTRAAGEADAGEPA